MTNITPTRLRALMKSLKSCPLCQNLNLRTSNECYVCGWRGVFEFDHESLRLGIADLEFRAPELLEVICAAANPRRSARLPGLLRALFVRVDCRV